MTGVQQLPDEHALAKASRRAAYLTLFGILMVAAAILFATMRLVGAEQRVADLASQSAKLQAQVEGLKDSARTTREELANARCALAASRSAISAFHQRNYNLAIELYDEALTCDPRNAYLLNLKAYAQFKAGHPDLAIQTQTRSLAVDSTYAWGYFDLARFRCAVSHRPTAEAIEAASTAVRLRPDLRRVMQQDGEFQKLCGNIESRLSP